VSLKACPLCGREVAEEMLRFHEAIEKVVLEMIQAQHPEWVASDGACPECIAYYRRMTAD